MGFDDRSGGLSSGPFEVAAGPLDRPAGRGRPPWLGPLLVVALAVGVVGVGLVGRSAPDGSSSAAGGPTRAPATPAPTPAPTPSARNAPIVTSQPLAPSLPIMSIYGEPLRGRVAFVSDGLRTLDLADATLSDPLPYDYGATIDDGAGGWLCACRSVVWSEVKDLQEMVVVRVGPDGRSRQVTSVSYEGLRPAGSATSGLALGSRFSPDRAWLFVASATRADDDTWAFALDAIPVAGGRSRSVRLGSFAGSPPDALAGEPEIPWVAEPTIRVAPDGRHVAVSGFIDRGPTSDGSRVTSQPRWIVPFEGRRFGPPVEVDRDDRAMELGCILDGWPSPDVFAEICQPIPLDGPPPDPVASPALIRRFDTAGRALVEITGPLIDLGGLAPIIEGGHGAIYGWDAIRHTLFSVDAATGRIESTSIPSPIPSVRTLGMWLGPDGVTISPDGRWLYALGIGTADAGPDGRPRPPGSLSTGVWTFDLTTLAFSGHWEPTALLSSIRLSADGSRLYAAGRGGVTADGRPSLQHPSISVFDAPGGTLRAVYGHVANGAGPFGINAVGFPS